MALLFFDGFDHYVTADFTKKWTSMTATCAVTAAAGRRGGAAVVTGATSGSLSKTLASAISTGILGAAVKIATAVVNARSILSYTDAGTVQASLRINVDGTLSVMRGINTGTVLATSVLALSAATFYYIEFKCTIHNTTGSYEVRVNGVNWVSGSSADTSSTANNTANGISVGWDGNPNCIATIEDVYVCDTSGPRCNDFLGDVRVDLLTTVGDGTYTDFTPDTGTAHWSRVADVAPDTSSYVTSSTSGHKDTYQFGDLTAVTGTIHGIQVCNAALKDDAGARSIANVVRSGSTDEISATVALSTSQLFNVSVHETDPNTSAAWTEAGVNAAQFGVKVAA